MKSCTLPKIISRTLYLLPSMPEKDKHIVTVFVVLVPMGGNNHIYRCSV